MKKGILIFAYNNRTVDYALMSIISGGLAKKHLNVPVSLATDQTTVDWMEKSGIYDKAKEVFDQIILTKKPVTDNKRRLFDGKNELTVPFANTNRASAWEITPYERTLLIDTDFLIFSDRLSEYWEVDEDIMIGRSINDIYDQKRLGYYDRYVSETGVHLYWATTVMFTKNQRSKAFFDMVNYVKDNYEHYGDLFRYSSRQYRNDVSFSVVQHLLNGFETDENTGLPPVLTVLDRDILHSVDSEGKLTFLISANFDENFCAAALKGTDVHIMNKQSITRNADKLLELI